MSTIIRSPKEEEVTTYVDAAGGGITYLGESKLGNATSVAKWRIMKIYVSGSITSMQYANGSRRYNQIWDNRASLTYSN